MLKLMRTLAAGWAAWTLGIGTLAAAPEMPEPTPRELDEFWKGLAHSEGRASDVADRLLAHPQTAIGFLKQRLARIGPFTEQELKEMVSQLDHDDIAVRRKAIADVKKLGNIMKPYLEAALRDNPSLELQRRAEALLKDLDGAAGPERRRIIWSVQILEVLDHFGHANAKPIIEHLATGHPGAFPTEEAKGALKRIEQRAKSP